jgi:phosphoglycerate dehydrogenase-like enzyme
MTMLTVWSNLRLPPDADAIIRDAVAAIGGTLVMSTASQQSNLVAGGPEDACRNADIAFGQPHVDDVVNSTSLKLVLLSSAGYTRYDNDRVRSALGARGVPLCTASGVFDEPCAQHVLAFMLAGSRQLAQAFALQPHQQWNTAPLRKASFLLNGQSALIVGYGTIAKRLVELLRPFHMKLVGVRRQPRGDEGIEMVRTADVDVHLGQFDHVINILPASDSTAGFFDAARLARLKPGAVFYNIGRGDTVDQAALVASLSSGRLAAAYLDVTTPEPLPAGHPQWTAPNCFITPHTAGGMADEPTRNAAHVAAQLRRFARGEPLHDRVV